MKHALGNLGWLTMLIALGSGCDSGYQEKNLDPRATSQPAVSSAPATIPHPEDTAMEGEALIAPRDTAGAMENHEGVAHFVQGHWDEAQDHFLDALAVNADLAEAHYNIALTLDKLGKHGEAIHHFQMALDLAPDDPRIKDSPILKAHLGG